MESIVTAQQGLRTVHETMRQTNVALLKIWSILTSEAPKVCSANFSLYEILWASMREACHWICGVHAQHTNTVMASMGCCAVVLAVIPFKYILIAGVMYGAVMTSKIGRSMQNEQGNRRMREWWDSIPIIPVEIIDNETASTSQQSDWEVIRLYTVAISNHRLITLSLSSLASEGCLSCYGRRNCVFWGFAPLYCI